MMACKARQVESVSVDEVPIRAFDKPVGFYRRKWKPNGNLVPVSMDWWKRFLFDSFMVPDVILSAYPRDHKPDSIGT